MVSCSQSRIRVWYFMECGKQGSDKIREWLPTFWPESICSSPEEITMAIDTNTVYRQHVSSIGRRRGLWPGWKWSQCTQSTPSDLTWPPYSVDTGMLLYDNSISCQCVRMYLTSIQEEWVKTLSWIKKNVKVIPNSGKKSNFYKEY